MPELVWDVVRAYAGARYSLGVPVVPEGVAVLNPFWAFDGFDAYVPPSVLQIFFPILVPATIATDAAAVRRGHARSGTVMPRAGEGEAGRASSTAA